MNWTKFERLQSAGHLMAWAARLFARRADRRLRPLGVSSAQLPTLLALADSGPLLQRDLVYRSAVAQPAMVATLARMERDGIIIRNPDERDARASIVLLTDKGESMLNAVYDVLAVGNDEALAGFSSRERAEAISYMRRIVENLADHTKRF